MTAKNTRETDWIRFLFAQKVLSIHASGTFQTKSGRSSPYFLNFGDLYSSVALREMGAFYGHWIKAALAEKALSPFNVVFGPAYKGIPLAVAITLDLGARLGDGADISYTFDRKEAKTYGDGGALVGKPLDATSRILIVDDVLTSGLSLTHAINLIQKTAPQATIAGILIGVDRLERHANRHTTGLEQTPQVSLSARQALEQQHNIPVHALSTIEALFTVGLAENFIDATHKDKLFRYLDEYGAA